MGSLSIAVIALAIGLWHDMKRFPDTNRTISELKEDVGLLKQDNDRLQNEVDRLEMQLLELSKKIDRINDPEYYSLLDAGDGWGLYELAKSRGEIE
ncbi:hypothetical protein I5370_21645 [Citrobacter sp. FDAARGOS_156]|uniref:hypothetical protein n=1 Tax=Citrobacter TaxID=544 RepID=UPI0010C9A7EE|nr:MULTISPECIES: hypothetical protein [Citrobacter]TKU11570.1 hypothetical protein FDW86_02895 [Citrobacter sp. wls828]MBJ8742626.1 hypothetical protein [Citrobacter sp. FDAARGOS_156]MEB0864156.1 hypothetical protein [Citrobacter youngae]HEF0077853.1 hypothetical protein [Citrobacter youngae]HEF0085363.1 hypothetical protein [Citrobacter youngae]